MSLQNVGNIAMGYSRAMDQTATKLSDPKLIENPGELAAFNIEMSLASLGYQMAARAAQNINQEDKLLAELLRDA